MFSLQFFYPSFFSYTEERDVEAETDMKPQCSCVVYSGILLTWDPLGGFGGGGGGGLGVENAQQDWERKRGKRGPKKNQ